MKAAIIGGGITGLTTAIALEQRGINYTLFEKAERLSEVGAGIWVSVNALQVFDRLGISNDIKKQGIELENVTVADEQFQPISSINQNILQNTFGHKTLSIHRATLQQYLYKQLPPHKINFGYEVDKIGGEHNTQLTFSNGETLHFDLILAADGIHSAIRKQLFPESKLRMTSQLCWRGIANYTMQEPHSASCIESWGKQVRFGFSVIDADKVYWFAVSSIHNKSSIEMNGLKTIFDRFDPLVQELIDNTPAADIIVRPLGDLAPMKLWHKGNCILLGDAAHATTPNMGQGAAQGIEDAYFFSKIVDIEAISASFQKFEAMRRQRVNFIVNNSMRLGKLAHIKHGQLSRNWLMRKLPDSITKKQLLSTYTLNPA